MKNLSETNSWWRRVRGVPFGTNWRFLLSKSTKTYCVGEKTISFENLVLSKLFQLIDSCWIRLGTSIFCRRGRCIRPMTIFGEWFHVRFHLRLLFINLKFSEKSHFFSYESVKIIMRNMAISLERKLKDTSYFEKKYLVAQFGQKKIPIVGKISDLRKFQRWWPQSLNTPRWDLYALPVFNHVTCTLNNYYVFFKLHSKKQIDCFILRL